MVLLANRLRRWLSDDRVILGAIVLCIAGFVGTTFSTVEVCLTWALMAAIGAMFARSLECREPAERSLRPPATARLWGGHVLKACLLVLGIAIGLLVIFQWRFVLPRNSSNSVLILAVDSLAHTFLALVCLLWAIRSARGHLLMLGFGMLAVLMTVAGGGVSSTLTAQTAMGLAASIGFVLAAQIVLSRGLGRLSAQYQAKGLAPTSFFVRASALGQHGRSDDLSSSAGRVVNAGQTDADGSVQISLVAAGVGREERLSFATQGWWFSLITISVVLIAGSAVARVADLLLPRVQAEVFSQLKDRFEDATAMGLIASGRYVVGDRIGQIRGSLLDDPAGLALRGYCDRPPGYLRGNVFDDYLQGRWHCQRRWARSEGAQLMARPAVLLSQALIPTQKRSGLDRNRFSLDPWAKPLVADPPVVGTLEIHGEPDRGRQLFYPTTSLWIEARSQRLSVTAHRLVNRGVDSTQPWVVGVGAAPIREPLTSADRGIMQWVDPEIRPAIERVAKQVAGRATTTQEKAGLIAEYFQSKYTYTLQTERAPRGVDPIVHFLETEHPAHCELFASASALLMRTLGVPTRYVTGYVMDELSDSQEYYLARNRDAHAWVEYYDESSQQWFSMESTPGRTYQTLTKANEARAVSRRAAERERESELTSGWLDSLMRSFTSMRLTDTLSVVFQALQLPLLLALVGWFWWHRRAQPEDENELRLARELRRMDRRWRRLGWGRRGAETLHQFADRLQAEPSDHPRFAELQTASGWYRSHATEVYRVGPGSGHSGVVISGS